MTHDPQFLRTKRGVSRSIIKKRKRYRTVLVFLTFLAVIAAVLTYISYNYLTAPDSFVVKELKIQGNIFTDDELIRETVLESASGNMLLANMREMCDAVEALPWIAQARAEKVIPDKLQISVVERTPTMYVLLHGELYLADESGTVIDLFRPEHPFIGLPVVTGLEGLDETVVAERIRLAGSFLQLVEKERPGWFDRISDIDLADPYRLSVRLTDVPTPIVVGADDVISRLNKYFSVEASLQQRYDNAEYFDVRFDRRLVVKQSGE